MSDGRWQRVKDLLYEAMPISPEQRGRFLQEACGSDAALRLEVESLLAADARIEPGFLNSLDAECEQHPEEIGAPDAMTPGEVFAERFRLTRKLGEGGMGQVWLAEQFAPVRRRVALKLIKAGMYDETVMQRFRSERQSLAIMDHPAIAKVFDAGTTPQGQPYFVMEYVPGLPITEYCDQSKLSIRSRLELFIQACDGVQHAHQKAIIHRDLKPANILVVEVDGKPVPRIIDFGLAKATASTIPEEILLTRYGNFMGTPGYMSPEQVDPTVRDIDTRADVYSLGVILYVLLVGLEPFESRREQRLPLDEWMRKLREEDPPNLTKKLSGDREGAAAIATMRATEYTRLVRLLRGDIQWITAKALERDRERRYGAPSDLAADLRRHLNHEPVVARPASAGYQIRMFARRHRAAVIVAGMVSALAVMASTAGLIAVRKQHEAEYQASQALQAQSRLLTQAAAQRLKDADVAGAQGVILEVLMNPTLATTSTAATVSVFQDIRAADTQIAVLSGHASFVLAAAYSPDGARIVTGSADRTARIWDARTGAQLAVLSGHRGSVNFPAYSRDGTRIATAGADKTVRIWDARTGAYLGVLTGHRDEVNCVAFSPDGRRVLTASEDGTARIWDADTFAPLAVLSVHGNHVDCAAYSPDGSHIVTAADDKAARIWDARTGAQLITLSGHEDLVYTATYSPDGTRIVTASGDHTARIWDARTGEQLLVLAGHGDRVYSAAYSADGLRIVTASSDHTARIWDARTGKQLGVLSGHGDRVRSAVFSRDGTRIITASDDATARVWDAGPGAQLAVFSGHGDRVYSAAYSRDGTRIVSASADGTARVWGARSGAQLASSSHIQGYAYYAGFSHDGARIVVASHDKLARVYDARTGVQLGVLSGHDGDVYTAVYSPDGTQIATASLDKNARTFDAKTGALRAVLSGHSGPVYSAEYSPDGTRIVTSSYDKTARIWDARTGAQLAVLSGHTGVVDSARYSPDGTRIVTTSLDKTARIWDARTGIPLSVLSGHSSAVNAADYSPDGVRIVTASNDRTARIWDAVTGAQLAVLSGHGDRVNTAAYSPDGTRIVTASLDKTVRVWNARVPAAITAQILWYASAQADPLPEVDRAQLGLPRDSRIRSWSAHGSACDQAAGAAYDPDRAARGILLRDIVVDIAGPACSAELAKPEHAARLDYQMGRVLFAKGDTTGAGRQFEIAVAGGYRAAGVDLADVLADAPAGTPDPARVEALYEKAWRDGVPIAAFRLGNLYERGLKAADGSPLRALSPDASKSWYWYGLGAQAGDPNALARFAEREESHALRESDPSRRDAQLLQSFTFYAAAAEKGRLEDWPDDAWKHWRHHRASLARLLAREDLMQQVADAYRAAQNQRLPSQRDWLGGSAAP